jgi:probable rRNA maturation factor
MSIEIANESGVEVDTDYMTELNHRWMGSDGPTDVLAFPMDEGSVDHGPGEAGNGEPALLGDIVLAPEVAAKQAAAAGHSAADELHLLTVHGALHLLGYDHAEPEEEREMFQLQARLLQSWRSGRRAG